MKLNEDNMVRDGAVIVPAIMADEWDSLTDQIELVAKGATKIQIDVMDGHLVPSFSFPYNKTILDGQRIPLTDSIYFEVHLMVQHPHEVGLRFIAAGANSIVAQIEGFRDGEASRVFNEWKEMGADTGVSLLLDTPLEQVTDLIESGDVSVVQVMSIARIGYQGEEFDERALVRIAQLRSRYPDVIIAVDGGVNEKTLEALLDAGANSFGVGSAIMKASDPGQALESLQQLLESYARRFQNN